MRSAVLHVGHVFEGWGGGSVGMCVVVVGGGRKGLFGLLSSPHDANVGRGCHRCITLIKMYTTVGVGVGGQTVDGGRVEDPVQISHCFVWSALLLELRGCRVHTAFLQRFESLSLQQPLTQRLCSGATAVGEQLGSR